MTEHIGRFHIRKRLGGGGFGEVFLAEDLTIGRQVAIKVFQPKDENLIAFATSSNTEGLDILRTRFLNEAKILAQLESAVHVVNVLEYGELPDGAPYYVMPYLPHSLADELGKDVFDVKALAELPEAQRPKALALERVLHISEQLLKGLAAAHAKGLVHRDIKPANVMLTEDGDVRIVDFGIAKAPDTQHSTVSHLGMGSRNYMAPEQRESAKHVDARADVYAAGRVVYRMLTGKLPVGRFADPNVAVPALGKAMNEVILAAISEDREARPADAAVLLARFQQAKASVGPQDSGEHSGTWAGEQGSSGLRDELKPLKARIIALVSEQGFLSEEAVGSLRALAAIADLDEPGLVSLIESTLKADKALSAKSKLGGLIRQAVKARGSALDERTLQTFHAAGEAVGWNAAHLQAVMQAALTDHSSEASTATRPQSPRGARPAPAAKAGTPPWHDNPRPSTSTGSSTGADGKPTEHTGRDASLPRSRLPMGLAAMLVLGGVGWGLVEWRQGQIAVEQRERALSAARESAAAASQQEARQAEEQRRADEARPAEAQRLADERRRAEEAHARLGGFEDLGGGSLRDTRTGLVWTQSDNGRDIDWNGASAHCQAKGMRLPTIDELQAIYERPGAGTTSCGDFTCKVSPLFRLTSFGFWSGTKEGSYRAFYLNLLDGYRAPDPLDHSFLNRALCVGRS